MTNRWHREATTEAERLGFEFDRVTGKGFDVYSGHGIEVVISPSIDEQRCRDAVKWMRKAAGVDCSTPHRNATAIRERRQRERERIARETAKHQSRLDEIRRVNAGRHLADVDRDEVKRIERRLTELDVLDRQMRDVPVGAHHTTKQGSTA